MSKFFKVAIDTFQPNFSSPIEIQNVFARTKDDFVKALNSFEGVIMIFDGHGVHEKNGIAKLKLIDEEIDVWEFREEIKRVPPIVVLSACDTHAADRSHASTANGFLSLGARTVLGTVFPIEAMNAATFIARLLFRVSEYVPAAPNVLGRSVAWLEVMSGMIRMQLLTDFCRRLLLKDIIDNEIYQSVHMDGNMAINGHFDWPFEVILSSLTERGVDGAVSRRELSGAIANSPSISYIQLGRPETILVHPDDFDYFSYRE